MNEKRFKHQLCKQAFAEQLIIASQLVLISLIQKHLLGKLINFVC